MAIGGQSSIFSSAQIITGKEKYNAQDVLEALVQVAGKTDEELSKFVKPNAVVLGLTLLYAVMTHCDIQEIIYTPTNGTCEGLLVTEKRWEKTPDIDEAKE